MLASKNLKNVYFMFRCAKTKHPNCVSMRNVAMKSSKKILQAYTTGIEFEGTRYCVTGKALVPENKVRNFTDELWKIKSSATNPTGIKALKILIGQQVL